MVISPRLHLPLLLLPLLLLACGDDDDGGGGGVDAGGAEDARVGEAGCRRDQDCDDGQYCNGIEYCVVEDGVGDCRPGAPMVCDDGIDCTVDSCSHATGSCAFTPPDADGDGYGDASCLGPQGEPLGVDCDDADPDRYPGNRERCDIADPTHDEDCSPLTVGALDADGDGFISDLCCNPDDTGALRCGDDCDDTERARNPGYPEICDAIDNDCDGEVDVGTREVPWYVDADGDDYGDADGDAVMSCAPVAGRSLRDSDCDDTLPSVHPAARELCDGLDNDCDGAPDGGGVCLCDPVGGQQPCACADGRSGAQTCQDGQWSACDCTECVDGVRECLGELLPRSCEAGRWVVAPACRGVRPLCVAGSCVCADGTQDCNDVVDVVPPYLLTYSPREQVEGVGYDQVVAVVFSEAVRIASVTGERLELRDQLGGPVAAAIAVAGSVATLTPEQPLRPGARYSVHVDAAIEDLAGNRFGESVGWEFMTAVRAVLEGTGFGGQGPALGVGPDGTLVLAATYIPPPPPPGQAGPASYTWARSRLPGEAWSPEATLPVGLSDRILASVGSSSRGYALLQQGATATVYGWVPGGAWGLVHSFTDEQPERASLLSLADGTAYADRISNNNLRFFVWDPQGVRSQASLSYGTGNYDRALSAGAGGHVARAWAVDNDLLVSLYLPAGDTPLQKGASGGVTDGYIRQLDAATDAAGHTMLLYARSVSGPATNPVGTDTNSSRARLLGPDGQWVTDEVSLQLGTSVVGVPHPSAVAFDAAGNAMLARLAVGVVRAVRYDAVGGFEGAERLSPPGAGAASEMALGVADDGSARVLWKQAGTFGGGAELWQVRYLPGQGYLPAERLTDGAAAVGAWSAGTDAAGTTYVILERGGALRMLTLQD